MSAPSDDDRPGTSKRSEAEPPYLSPGSVVGDTAPIGVTPDTGSGSLHNGTDYEGSSVGGTWSVADRDTGARRRSLALIDRILLGASYLLLVLVVVVGGFWLQNTLDDAKSERCNLAFGEVALFNAHLLSLQDQLSADQFNEIKTQLSAAVVRIEQECGPVPSSPIP